MQGIAVVKRRLRPHNLLMTSRIRKVPAVSASNPLLQDFDLPSYSLIKPEHVEPAMASGDILDQRLESGEIGDVEDMGLDRAAFGSDAGPGAQNDCTQTTFTSRL